MGLKVPKTFASANEEYIEIDYDSVDTRYKLRTRKSGTGAHFNIGLLSGELYELILDTKSLTTASKDNGANAGFFFKAARNSNASPAAGFIKLEDKGGQDYRVWADDAGLLRIHTADPINANDTAGTVVGDQTSNLAFKTDVKILSVQERYQAIAEVLTASREALHSFKYKDNRYNGEKFPNGLVVNFAPRYGMDKNADFPEGKVLNIHTAIADLFVMAEYLYNENKELKKLLHKIMER